MGLLAQLGFKTNGQNSLLAYELGGDLKLSIDSDSIDKYVQAGALISYGTYTCDIVSNAAIVKRDNWLGVDHCLLASPYVDFKLGRRVEGRAGFFAPPLGNENLIRGLDTFNSTSLPFSKVPFNAAGLTTIIHTLDENLLNVVLGVYNLDATREAAPGALAGLSHETPQRRLALTGVFGFNAPQLPTNAVPTESPDRLLFGLINAVAVFRTPYITSMTDLVFRHDQNRDALMKTTSLAAYTQLSTFGSVLGPQFRYLEAAIRGQFLLQYSEPSVSGQNAPVGTQGTVTGRGDLRFNAGFVWKSDREKNKSLEGLNESCGEEGERCLIRFIGFVEGSLDGSKVFGTTPLEINSVRTLQFGAKLVF